MRNNKDTFEFSQYQNISSCIFTKFAIVVKIGVSPLIRIKIITTKLSEPVVKMRNETQPNAYRTKLVSKDNIAALISEFSLF